MVGMELVRVQVEERECCAKKDTQYGNDSSFSMTYFDPELLALPSLTLFVRLRLPPTVP